MTPFDTVTQYHVDHSNQLHFDTAHAKPERGSASTASTAYKQFWDKRNVL